MSLKSKSHSFLLGKYKFWEDNMQLIIIHLLPSQNSHLRHHLPCRVHISAPLWALPCYKIYSASKFKTLAHSSINSKSKTISSNNSVVIIKLSKYRTDAKLSMTHLGENSCINVTNSPLPKHNSRTIVQLIISF